MTRDKGQVIKFLGVAIGALVIYGFTSLAMVPQSAVADTHGGYCGAQDQCCGSAEEPQAPAPCGCGCADCTPNSVTCPCTCAECTCAGCACAQCDGNCADCKCGCVEGQCACQDCACQHCTAGRAPDGDGR